METTTLSPASPARKLAVLDDYRSRVDGIKNQSARYELMEGFSRCRKNDYVSWHTGLLHKNHGSTCRDAVMNFVKKSGVFKMEKNYRVDHHCREYVFAKKYRDLLGQTDVRKSGENQATYNSPIPFSSSFSLSFIPSEWTYRRSLSWSDYCSERGLTMPVDYFGLDPICRSVFQAIESVELPGDWVLAELSDVRVNESRLSPREHAQRWLDRARSGEVIRCLKRKSGRYYHALTNCPGLVRQNCLLGGEGLAEADLRCSYFAILAGEMADTPERQRLIDRLPDFYEWIEEASPRLYASGDDGDMLQAAFEAMNDTDRRDTVKEECQRQLLFGIDWRLKSRPLWKTLRREFPLLASLICERRKRFGGASGFARHLMTLEGKVMTPAMQSLIDSGVLALPLHDGLLVPESFVEVAANAIRDAGREQLGFTPLVKAK